MDRLSASDIMHLMGDCKDGVIFNALMKTNTIINKPEYKNIMCSISGGSDSDIMLDMCQKLDVNHKTEYVWFNTGVEYQATKEHIKYLEEKYGIEIVEQKPVKTIPASVKEYGQPFVSKRVSQNIERLQRSNFKWEDEPFEVLVKRYCKKADEEKRREEKRRELNRLWQSGKKPYHWLLINGEWFSGSISALQWWCNTNREKNGQLSRFSISQNTWLKEFLIKNPPTFKISAKCCEYAKKQVAHNYYRDNSIDLSLVGVRKAEGGARATAYKTCYSVNEDTLDYHRPIFYFTDENKKNYEKAFGVCHSRCYTEYGLKRTGCVGCPFNRKITEEIKVIEQHEPKLHKLATTIFKDTYELTREYREFQKFMSRKKRDPEQYSLFD